MMKNESEFTFKDLQKTTISRQSKLTHVALVCGLLLANGL